METRIRILSKDKWETIGTWWYAWEIQDLIWKGEVILLIAANDAIVTAEKVISHYRRWC